MLDAHESGSVRQSLYHTGAGLILCGKWRTRRMIWPANTHNEQEQASKEDWTRMGILLDLRQAILQRVGGKSEQELVGVIRDSIGGDDRALPGLGVLFEIIWENIDEDTRQKLVAALHEQVNPS